MSYTLDGVDVPGSIAAGALQAGFALPDALAGTNAQLVSSPGSSAFEYANALQIGTETTATMDLSGNVMGISYSPIYSNGLLNFSFPGVQFTATSPTTANFTSQVPVSRRAIAPHNSENKNAQRLKKIAEWYLCGRSPADNAKNWMFEGGVKGIVFGVISGGLTGTIFGTPVGGVLGAILGGVTEGTVGAGGGVLYGTAASIGCAALGVY